MKAEIITIGDEILIGQTVDTNSAWMAKRLNKLGIAIAQITSISDTREHILWALKEAEPRADLVLMTGGLGPTRDDITKITLCEYFGTELVMHDDIREQIEDYFNRRGVPVLEVNRKQAELPATCTPIPNVRGTAQGMWFEHNGTVFVSMPGVPYEMQGIMEDHLLEKIKNHFTTPHIEHYTIMTHGIGESLLADKVADWEDSLDAEDIHIAYLPSPGVVKVRLSATGDDADAIKEKVKRKAKEFLQLAGEHVFAIGDEPIEKAVGELLRKHKLTVGSAESCTGGGVAAALTSVAGSSDYFMGSIVAYHNKIKMEQLGVQAETLMDHGAVSEATVLEMAEGARKQLGVDYAMATSGVAGPDGGSEEKPVGLVWIAVAGPKRTVAQECRFGRDRERNIQRAIRAVLGLLRSEILEADAL
jgi:nicotinamide-nucleotide amidase